jgi:hypothetical protein
VPVKVANVVYSLKRDSKNGTVMPYYSVTLPRGIGNAINKYFENTNADYVNCSIEFKYSATRDGNSIDHTISHETRLYFGNSIR